MNLNTFSIGIGVGIISLTIPSGNFSMGMGVTYTPASHTFDPITNASTTLTNGSFSADGIYIAHLD